MKKITIAFVALVAIAGMAIISPSHSYAESISVAAPNTLLFDNITSTSVRVRLNLNISPYASALANKQPISIGYYPSSGCTPSMYGTCPAAAMPPTILTFTYNGTASILDPVVVSGLVPSTTYVFVPAYDNGIRCVTTPCPSLTFDTLTFPVTTLPAGHDSLQNTQLSFTVVTQNSVRVTMTLPSNLLTQLGNSFRLYYRTKVCSDEQIPSGMACATYMPQDQVTSFVYDSANKTYSATLTGLQPATTYLAWVEIDTKRWTFTTLSGTGFDEKTLLTQKLMLGMHSNEVQVLQAFLIKEGFLSGTADGAFGPMTYRAVRDFQSAYGLSVDGRVGTKTRYLINKLNNVL